MIQSAVGAAPMVRLMLSSEQQSDLAARIEGRPWQFVGQELPQFSVAPTDHYSGLRASSVGMRLFTVSQRGGFFAPMIRRPGLRAGSASTPYSMKTICRQRCLGATTGRAGPWHRCRSTCR